MKTLLTLLILLLPGAGYGAGTVVKTTSPVAARNYVINGGFNFNQRYGIPGSYTLTTGLAYAHDRFSYLKSGTCTSAAVATNTSTLRTGARSPNTAQISWSSSTCDHVGLRHKFERDNIYNLIGQKVTLSFWVYFSTLSGLPSTPIQIMDAAPSAVDNWSTSTAFTGGTGRGSVALSLLTAATWYKVTATWTVPTSVGGYSTSNGYGFDIYIDYDNSTSVAPTIYLGEVMFNEGASASPFQLAGGDIQGELAKCQRYFEMYTVDNNPFPQGIAQVDAVNRAESTILYSKKRSNPVISTSDYTKLSFATGTSTNLACTGDLNTHLGTGPYSANIFCVVSSLSGGAIGSFIITNSAGNISINSEL